MNTQAESPGVAVVGERSGDDAAAMETYLQGQSVTGARWYEARDLDEVDAAVREGSVRRVVFGDMNGLLEGIWDQEIEFERWLAAGVRVEFVEGPGASPEAYVGAVFRSWQRWAGRRRRRQVVAGLVLSVVALGAAFLLSWAAA